MMELHESGEEYAAKFIPLAHRRRARLRAIAKALPQSLSGAELTGNFGL